MLNFGNKLEHIIITGTYMKKNDNPCNGFGSRHDGNACKVDVSFIIDDFKGSLFFS